MKNATRRTAVLLSTAALVAGSAVLPLSATAAQTECGPGDVSISFTPGSVAIRQGDPLESATLTNPSPQDAAIPATRMAAASSTAKVPESVSLTEILAALKSAEGIDAFEEQDWAAGSQIGALTLSPGQSMDATYGFSEVVFSGSQQTCQLDGRFGTATNFSGTAPTGHYIAYS